MIPLGEEVGEWSPGKIKLIRETKRKRQMLSAL